MQSNIPQGSSPRGICEEKRNNFVKLFFSFFFFFLTFFLTFNSSVFAVTSIGTDITTGGKIGIGTTAPTDKLDIFGGVKIGAGYAGVGTAPANGMLIQGMLGIGTTGPDAKLVIDSTGVNEVFSVKSGGTKYMHMYIDPAAGATKGIGLFEGTYLAFENNATTTTYPELYIKNYAADGFALIKTTGALATDKHNLYLQSSGSIYLYDTNNDPIYVQGTGGIVPATTNTNTLGSSSKIWGDGYFKAMTFNDGSSNTVKLGSSATAGTIEIYKSTGAAIAEGVRILSSASFGAGTQINFGITGSPAIILNRIESVLDAGNQSSLRLYTYDGTLKETMRINYLGNVGVGTTLPGEKLEVNGGMRLNTATAKPTCDATHRGTQWFVQGAAGVKDTLEVCAKDAGDAYAWRTLY